MSGWKMDTDKMLSTLVNQAYQINLTALDKSLSVIRRAQTREVHFVFAAVRCQGIRDRLITTARDLKGIMQ